MGSLQDAYLHHFQFMREFVFHLSKKKIKKETKKKKKGYPLHHGHKRQTMHKLMTFFSLHFVSDVLGLHLARAHLEFHSQTFLQSSQTK